MDTNPKLLILVLATIVAVLIGYGIGRARADGAPATTPLFFSGELEDGGRPVDGARGITVRLWDAAAAGTALCTTTAPGTMVSAGRFRIALDASCAAAVHARSETWVEVTVDATTFPRQKIGAAPYALEAGRAAGASGPLEVRIAAAERTTAPPQVEISTPVHTTTTIASGTAWQPVAGLSLSFTARQTGVYRVHTILCAPVSSPLRIVPTGTAGTILWQPSVSAEGVGLLCKALELFIRLDAGMAQGFRVEVSAGSQGAGYPVTMPYDPMSPSTSGSSLVVEFVGTSGG